MIIKDKNFHSVFRTILTMLNFINSSQMADYDANFLEKNLLLIASYLSEI